jgi:uncharacterized small protein (TIGR04563 family)
MDKNEVGLYWPETILRHIKAEATRMDRSLSWCVQKAWLLARVELSRLEPGAAHPRAEERYSQLFAAADGGAGSVRKQTMFFPDEMMLEIAAEAARLDRSQSWLLHRAWSLALDEIATYPSVG